MYSSQVFELVHSKSLERANELSRRKRFLVYGPTTALQLIIGFGTPVADLLTPATTLGFFLRGVYAVPTNSSYYTMADIPIQTRSSVTRWDLYKALEKDSETRGHGGRSCVLRAICEAAETPMDRYHGFLEEVFHTIFTPTSTQEKLNHHTDNEYLAAYHLGKSNKGKCLRLFPDCTNTFLDLFTQLFSND